MTIITPALCCYVVSCYAAVSGVYKVYGVVMTIRGILSGYIECDVGYVVISAVFYVDCVTVDPCCVSLIYFQVSYGDVLGTVCINRLASTRSSITQRVTLAVQSDSIGGDVETVSRCACNRPV